MHFALLLTVLTMKVRTGSLAELDALVERLAPEAPLLLYMIIPKVTLARRKREGKLTAAESAKVARLNDVVVAAVDVWKTEETARDFLFRRHPMLGMQTPFEVALASDSGAALVQEVIGRLKHGTGI